VKEDVYTSLNIATPGAGYTHFSATLEPEYFRQITSEQLVKATKDFVTTLQWVKKNERNETLDCAVYARAAVAVLRPAYKSIKRRLDAQAERLALQKEKPAEEVSAPPSAPLPEPVPEPAPVSEPKRPLPADPRINRLAAAFGARVVSAKPR
jgi:phage terminase large subunit GpA-like protein